MSVLSASPGTTSRGRSRRVTASIVASACLAQIMIVLDTTIIAVALPSAQADLGFDTGEVQWTITAYTLASGSLLLLGGRVSQRLGIRNAFLIGLIGFAVASLVGGMATTLWVFLLARAVQGVFAALLAPTNLSMMNVAFPDSGQRAKAFALFGAVAGAGAAIGLILGGVLTDMLSWRWCLFVNLPLAGLAAVVAKRALASLPGPIRQEGKGDVLGMVLGTSGVFGLVYGFSRAESHGWSDALTLSVLSGGGALVVAFLARQRVAASPLLPLSILTDRVRAASYLAIAGVGLAQMGSSLYLTYYFQNQLGYSPTRTGLLFLPMVGGLILAAVASTRFIVPRWGLATALPAGAAVQAIAFLALSTLGPDSPFGNDVLFPLFLGGMGIGLVMAPAMSSATAGVTKERSGLASAVANTSQQIGASLGVAFLTTWASRRVAESMSASQDVIAQQGIQSLREAGVVPGSKEAAALTDAIQRTVTNTQTIDAYASGFLVMSIAAAAIAVLTFILLRVRRDGMSS